MQWVFLIGDKGFSLDDIERLEFRGGEVRRNEEQLEVRFGQDGYAVFCREEAPEEMRSEFEEGEYEAYMGALPFGEPVFIMLRYSDIGVLRRIVSDEEFPENIVVDCDGVRTGVEEILGAERVIGTEIWKGGL